MDKVDIYCERIDGSFWSEPVNAITNIAFIIAALACLNLMVRRDRVEPLTILLFIVLCCIGTGSFLWHTFAEGWAGAADTISILVFILIYLYAATRRFFDAPVWMSAAVPILFIPSSVGFMAAWGAALPSVNGSEGYFPVLLIIIIYGVALWRLVHAAAGGMIATAALLSLSLTFRSVDDAVCQAFPLGTHFMWHILNGVLLGVVLATFIRHGAPKRA